MASTDSADEQKKQQTARLEWIEKAYTVVGTFWAGWAIAALVGISTRGNVKVPAFGEVTFTEVVVYSLYAFTLGIPLLLTLVFRHRRIQKASNGLRLLPAPHFPTLGASGMPPFFRTLAFVGLVVLPIVAQEIAFCRLYGEVCIAWKPHKWWQTENYKTVLNGSNLFTFPPKPDARDYANWRFMRLDLPNWGVVDRKERPPRREDDDGRPVHAKQKEPVQITAFPGYAPWAFGVSAVGSGLLAGLLFATRDDSLIRRLLCRLQKRPTRPASRRKRRS